MGYFVISCAITLEHAGVNEKKFEMREQALGAKETPRMALNGSCDRLC